MRYKQAGNYPTAESTRSIMFNLNCMRVSHIFFFLFYPRKKQNDEKLRKLDNGDTEGSFRSAVLWQLQK